MTNKKIKLFANCIPVKGANRSVICDLQRQELKVIPNDLYHILKEYESHSINDIKRIYENKYDEVIEEYFEFLISNEFVFLTNTPEIFPKLKETWIESSDITNSIIDIDENSNYDYLSFVNQLEGLNCKHIEVRFFNTPSTAILDILKNLKINESIIHSVDVVVDRKFEKVNFFKNLFVKYPRLNSVVLYNSNETNITYPVPNSPRRIVSSKGNLASSIHCGVISSTHFAVNVKNFTESLQFNSCLNKKMSIDVNGDIKNCPSMSQSFGNIKDIKLQEALNHTDYKKNWSVTKDQIDVCKDCEFRYVCTDCRAYTERTKLGSGIDLSKPLKCGYNPYINEWEEWSTNPLKEKAIEYYKMEDLVKTNK